MASPLRSSSGQDPAARLRALAEEVYRRQRNATAAVALELVRQIKIELSQPGRGRVYARGSSITRGRRRRAARRRYHVASRPGDPPAVDTGKLRQSIDWAWDNAGQTRARVGTNVVYAPWLEFGAVTRHGTLLPRPFMRPAVEKLRARATEILAGALRIDRLTSR